MATVLEPAPAALPVEGWFITGPKPVQKTDTVSPRFAGREPADVPKGAASTPLSLLRITPCPLPSWLVVKSAGLYIASGIVAGAPVTPFTVIVMTA